MDQPINEKDRAVPAASVLNSYPNSPPSSTKSPSVKTWMPLYWGDYHRDTGHLRAAEHGAYLLLIGHYWTNGRPLPDDDNRLAAIARMSADEWHASRDVLADLFTIEDGFWRHKRVEAELAQAIDNAARSRKRTQAASEARKRQRNDQRNDDRNVGRYDHPRAGEGEGEGPNREKGSDKGGVEVTDPSWESAA